MPSRTEVSDEWPMRGEKALGMARRPEPSHGPFPLARRSVGVFRTIIHIAVLPVFHARHYLPLSSLVALELIGDDQPGDIPAPLEERAEEFLGRSFVPPALHRATPFMVLH
jgi:hypothetical protein